MLWVLLTQWLQVLPASRVWAAPALPVLAGGIVWVLTSADCLPSARLKKQIGVLADLTGPDFKVAGFNSFLTVRWYAHFNLPPDSVARLVREKGLTRTAVDDRSDKLRQASPFGEIANEAGVVPSWTAAQIWQGESGKPTSVIQSTSWGWFAVDETGTNCFFTWGYQNRATRDLEQLLRWGEYQPLRAPRGFRAEPSAAVPTAAPAPVESAFAEAYGMGRKCSAWKAWDQSSSRKLRPARTQGLIAVANQHCLDRKKRQCRRRPGVFSAPLPKGPVGASSRGFIRAPSCAN